jgi:FixJ family two-component response regulator
MAAGSSYSTTMDHSVMTEEPLVFVIDDDPSVRKALDRLLRSVGLDVRTFASAEEFQRSERPDTVACLVLDIRMPGQSGLDFQSELVKMKNELPIVFITGHGDIPMSVRAMKAGAIEFLTKPFRDQDLIDAVQMGLKKNRLRREKAARLADLRERYAALTSREREIMTRVAAGLLNKQIAAELDVSHITVKVHRAQLMKKMLAKSLADLIRMADRLGVGPDNDGAES